VQNILGNIVQTRVTNNIPKSLGYVTQGYGNILKAGSNKDPRVILGEYSYVPRLIKEHTPSSSSLGIWGMFLQNQRYFPQMLGILKTLNPKARSCRLYQNWNRVLPCMGPLFQ